MSPRIAIVTPWNGVQSGWMDDCSKSVRAQTHPCLHLLVLDGVPFWGLAKPPRDMDHSRVMTIPGVVGVGHQDAGNLARGLGALLCAAEGYDAIAFLDADNWVDSDHLARLWERHQETGMPIVAARRWMHALDGEPLYRENDEHAAEHVDTNCMFFAKAAFDLLSIWTQIPGAVAAVGDQVFWKVARAWLGARPPYVTDATVHYRTAYAVHYEAIGRVPPIGCKRLPEFKPGDLNLRFNVKSFGGSVEP